MKTPKTNQMPDTNKASFPWIECVAIAAVLIGAAYLSTAQISTTKHSRQDSMDATEHASLPIHQSIENGIEMAMASQIDETRKHPARKQADLNKQMPNLEMVKAQKQVSRPNPKPESDSNLENQVVVHSNVVENTLTPDAKAIVWISEPVAFMEVPIDIVRGPNIDEVSTGISTFLPDESFQTQKITLLPALPSGNGRLHAVGAFPIQLISGQRSTAETAKRLNIRRLPAIPESESEPESIHRR